MLVLQGFSAGEIESTEPVSSGTVLVVEDTVYLLEVIQLQFQAEGCLPPHMFECQTKLESNCRIPVETIANPLDALTRCKRRAGEFMCVICDVTMPKMSGPELTKQLR